MRDRIETGPVSPAAIVALFILASLALVLSLVAMSRTSGFSSGASVDGSESALQRIKREGTIRVGYGGFPPYTIVNPSPREGEPVVSGFAVDLINEIAQRHSPPLRVEWFNLDWQTLPTDMDRGNFDVLADAVYYEIDRASDYLFTDPFSFFGIGAAVVRIRENRFTSFEDLNRPDIRIAVAAGYTSTDLAARRLTQANLDTVLVGEDPFSQANEVILGRADVALNNVPTVLQFVREHSTQVKGLWLEDPPASVPAGFLLRKQDRELLDFLNVGIQILLADGTLAEIDRRWGGLGNLPVVSTQTGAGLAPSR